MTEQPVAADSLMLAAEPERYRMCAECFFLSRRRISSDEIPSSAFCLNRDLSIKAINFGLLLKATVSMSALMSILGY